MAFCPPPKKKKLLLSSALAATVGNSVGSFRSTELRQDNAINSIMFAARRIISFVICIFINGGGHRWSVFFLLASFEAGNKHPHATLNFLARELKCDNISLFSNIIGMYV